MLRKRTQAREHALKILYQVDITKRSLELILADYWKMEEIKDEQRKEYAAQQEAAKQSEVTPLLVTPDVSVQN